jgi:hypothetical protein
VVVVLLVFFGLVSLLDRRLPRAPYRPAVVG